MKSRSQRKQPLRPVREHRVSNKLAASAAQHWDSRKFDSLDTATASVKFRMTISEAIGRSWNRSTDSARVSSDHRNVPTGRASRFPIDSESPRDSNHAAKGGAIDPPNVPRARQPSVGAIENPSLGKARSLLLW